MSKTPAAPRAPRAKAAPAAPVTPSKTRKRGRPPTVKCDLSALKQAAERQELENLFWATARAIIEHTEYCHPGQRDHIAGLGSLTALMRLKITKSETDGAEDMKKIAEGLNAWIRESDRERGMVSVASKRLELDHA